MLSRSVAGLPGSVAHSPGARTAPAWDWLNDSNQNDPEHFERHGQKWSKHGGFSFGEKAEREPPVKMCKLLYTSAEPGSAQSHCYRAIFTSPTAEDAARVVVAPLATDPLQRIHHTREGHQPPQQSNSLRQFQSYRNHGHQEVISTWWFLQVLTSRQAVIKCKCYTDVPECKNAQERLLGVKTGWFREDCAWPLWRQPAQPLWLLLVVGHDLHHGSPRPSPSGSSWSSPCGSHCAPYRSPAASLRTERRPPSPLQNLERQLALDGDLFLRRATHFTLPKETISSFAASVTRRRSTVTGMRSFATSRVGRFEVDVGGPIPRRAILFEECPCGDLVGDGRCPLRGNTPWTPSLTLTPRCSTAWLFTVQFGSLVKVTLVARLVPCPAPRCRRRGVSGGISRSSPWCRRDLAGPPPRGERRAVEGHEHDPRSWWRRRAAADAAGVHLRDHGGGFRPGSWACAIVVSTCGRRAPPAARAVSPV